MTHASGRESFCTAGACGPVLEHGVEEATA